MTKYRPKPVKKVAPEGPQIWYRQHEESDKTHQPSLLSRGSKVLDGVVDAAIHPYVLSRAWEVLHGLVDAVLRSDVKPDVKLLYLFTCDQILDTVIPGTFFGILGALSGPVLHLPSQPWLSVLARAPAAALWLWFVILQFCVQNQRSPGSVTEDSINKPWRPIPSGRMTAGDAEKLLTVTHFVAGAYSYALGVLPIFLIYVCLITAYNDFGASNKSGIVRNLFCGAGFSCYFGGALSIAIGPDVAMSFAAWKWTLTVTFGILATTIQTQEFRDEAGDQARGRRTLVTELGRKAALWTVLVTVPFWSLYAPLGVFPAGWLNALLPTTLGSALLATALQAFLSNDNKLDRRMYKIWCLWMVGFCPLPFLARILAHRGGLSNTGSLQSADEIHFWRIIYR